MVPEVLEERLIEEVKRHALLYNKNFTCDKNSFIRAEAWAEICDKLGLDLKVAKLKWKILRDRFLIEWRKRHKLAKEGKPVRNRWKHFERMKFLKPMYIKQRTSSSTGRKALQITTNNQDEITKEIVPRNLTFGGVTTIQSIRHKSSSISLFFQALSTKIEEANLPHQNLVELRCRVLSTVNDVLSKHIES